MSDKPSISPSSDGPVSVTTALKTNGHSGHEPVATRTEDRGQAAAFRREFEVLRFIVEFSARLFRRL